MAAGRKTTRALILWAALLVLCAIPAVGLLACFIIADPFGDLPHPTDETMLTQFRAQRKNLEELVRMIAEDPKLIRLGPDFTRPEDAASAGVSADRIAVYRRLCAEAGITDGFSHYGDAIEFLVHTRGLAISGSAKGFVYAPSADLDARLGGGDLDAAAASATDKDVLFERKIDESWWLELDMR